MTPTLPALPMPRPPRRPSPFAPVRTALRIVLVVGLCLGLPCACGPATDPGAAAGRVGKPSPPAPVTPGANEIQDTALRRLLDNKIEAARANPGDPAAHGSLGLVYQVNGLQEEALASFRNAAGLEPAQPLWRLREAEALRSLGDLDGALELLARVADELPDSAPAQERFADALFAAGRSGEALERFRRAAELAPRRPEGLVGAGAVLLEEGKVREAVALLEQAVSLDPNYRHAHFVLGGAYRAAGRDGPARTQLALGIDGKPRPIPDPLHGEEIRYRKTTPARIGQAKSLLERGDAKRARDVLQRALAADPEDVLVLNNLARAELALGNGERALELLERARGIEPARPLTEVNRARVLTQMGRGEAALESARRAVAGAPGFAPARLARSLALRSLGRIDQALAAARSALALAPRDEEILRLTIELADRQGDREQVLSSLERLLEVTPLDAEAALRLAGLLANDGEPDRARPYLERAARLLPGDARVKSLRKRLETP